MWGLTRILALYPKTLLSLLISLGTFFFVSSFQFSTWIMMSSANKDHFIPSFPVSYTFYFLAALASSPRVMVSWSGKQRRVCCWFLSLEEAPSFSLLSFLYVFRRCSFVKLRKFPLLLVCREFLLWMSGDCFFYIY